jgi:hypothetical protein
MNIIVGVIFIGIASLLQVTIVGRITLLQGPTNLVLLVMLSWSLRDENLPDWRWGLPAGLILSLFSALPLWVLLISYSLAAASAQILQQRVWQSRLLTLFTSVAVGTLLIDGTSLSYLWLNASSIPLIDAFNLVILPSMVVNMILLLPILTAVNELGKLLIPAEAAS